MDGLNPRTSWRLVLESRDPDSDIARGAMEEFSRVYWLPVYGHVRRRVGDAERALDLTQEFFLTWLERRWNESADPAKGRFRTFLFVVLDRFLADRRDHDQAAKRGGGRGRLSLDAATAEALLSAPESDGGDPARAFNHRWAMALVREALDGLRDSLKADGKALHYDLFVAYYGFAGERADYAGLARRHGVSETDVTNYLHRARALFRRILEERVLQSVESAEEVKAEVAELFRALSS